MIRHLLPEIEPVYEARWPDGQCIVGYRAVSPDGEELFARPYKAQVMDELVACTSVVVTAEEGIHASVTAVDWLERHPEINKHKPPKKGCYARRVGVSHETNKARWFCEVRPGGWMPRGPVFEVSVMCKKEAA